MSIQMECLGINNYMICTLDSVIRLSQYILLLEKANLLKIDCLMEKCFGFSRLYVYISRNPNKKDQNRSKN